VNARLIAARGPDSQSSSLINRTERALPSIGETYEEEKRKGRFEEN
jgi:hypothetical protein